MVTNKVQLGEREENRNTVSRRRNCLLASQATPPHLQDIEVVKVAAGDVAKQHGVDARAAFVQENRAVSQKACGRTTIEAMDQGKDNGEPLGEKTHPQQRSRLSTANGPAPSTVDRPRYVGVCSWRLENGRHKSRYWPVIPIGKESGTPLPTYTAGRPTCDQKVRLWSCFPSTH